MTEIELLILLTDSFESANLALLQSSEVQRVSTLHRLEAQDCLQILGPFLLPEVPLKAAKVKFMALNIALLHLQNINLMHAVNIIKT